jgi:hypothetical protein
MPPKAFKLHLYLAFESCDLERTWWRLLQKRVVLDLERTRSRLLQKRVVLDLERTRSRLLQKRVVLDLERTWWRLLQKCVVRNNLQFHRSYSTTGNCFDSVHVICHKWYSIFDRKVWRYLTGNQKPQIKEGQTIPWPKEKEQNDNDLQICKWLVQVFAIHLRFNLIWFYIEWYIERLLVCLLACLLDWLIDWLIDWLSSYFMHI